MSAWETKFIGQLCKMNPSSYTSKDHWEYINYLDTGSITRNLVEGYEYIDLTQSKLPSRAKRKVEVGDILYSTVRPNLRHYGILEYVPDNCLVSTGFAVIRAEETKVNPRYLYYYLTLPNVVEQLQSIGEQGQATYPAINPSDIEETKIALPDRRVQDKVVLILSDYDAAIANCRRQIALLEEAAQRLYREWFAKGKGEKRRFGDIASVSSGKRPLQKSREHTKDCTVPLIGASEQMGYTSGALYSEPVLITGRVGTHGIVQRITEPCWPSDNTLVVKSRYMAFSYQFMKRIDYGSMNRGVAQPLLTQSDIKDVSLCMPKESLLLRYEQDGGELLKGVDALSRQIRTLTEARDRLLPKLMSGEVAI